MHLARSIPKEEVLLSIESLYTPRDEEYAKAVTGEAEYWDAFVAQWLLRGKMPGSIDFRIAFTQHRYENDWQPFCLGIPGINFRMKEIRYILDAATARPGTRILDLGCGAGWLSLELARLGAHVTGVDISPTNLAIGRYMAETNTRNFPFLYQRLAGLPCKLEDFGSIEYVRDDLNNVNLPPHEYDAVVVADSLHHISNIERLVEQVRHSLKPGGVFVGMDHAFATPHTTMFNLIFVPWISDFYNWVTANDPEWLYDSMIETGKQYDWGVLNIDYASPPLLGFDRFTETLFAELLDVVRGTMPADLLNTAHTASKAEQGELQEESPFEDISAERLAEVLIDSFQAERFETICPFIHNTLEVPHYRSEKERLFQHYISAMLIEIGEYAISKGEADGQWLLFSLTGEHPKGVKPVNPFAQENAQWEAWPNAKLELSKMARYVEFLEAEIVHKNTALQISEQYQQRLETELHEARRPRLPWKKRPPTGSRQ
jgi:SAM-dependent methyltransferase